MGLLELIVVILLVLWLFGYFGRGRVYYRTPLTTGAAPWYAGNLIHLILVLVVLLIILRLLGLT